MESGMAEFIEPLEGITLKKRDRKNNAILGTIGVLMLIISIYATLARRHFYQHCGQN